ncbi:MAG: hypothetical protein D3908_16465 [Candidatus Electrothrix sp. AUS4]|nr:hypothetical protein [Candidatus Electrothrix sp. AUS4]
MSESVEAIKKMFYKIVNSYDEAERPLIIIKGSVQVTTDNKESEQVKVAVGILEEHKFGFIRVTGSLFNNFSLAVCRD